MASKERIISNVAQALAKPGARKVARTARGIVPGSVVRHKKKGITGTVIPNPRYVPELHPGGLSLRTSPQTEEVAAEVSRRSDLRKQPSGRPSSPYLIEWKDGTISGLDNPKAETLQAPGMERPISRENWGQSEIAPERYDYLEDPEKWKAVTSDPEATDDEIISTFLASRQWQLDSLPENAETAILNRLSDNLNITKGGRLVLDDDALRLLSKEERSDVVQLFKKYDDYRIQNKLTTDPTGQGTARFDVANLGHPDAEQMNSKEGLKGAPGTYTAGFKDVDPEGYSRVDQTINLGPREPRPRFAPGHAERRKKYYSERWLRADDGITPDGKPITKAEARRAIEEEAKTYGDDMPGSARGFRSPREEYIQADSSEALSDHPVRSIYRRDKVPVDIHTTYPWPLPDDPITSNTVTRSPLRTDARSVRGPVGGGNPNLREPVYNRPAVVDEAYGGGQYTQSMRDVGRRAPVAEQRKELARINAKRPRDKQKLELPERYPTGTTYMKPEEAAAINKARLSRGEAPLDRDEELARYWGRNVDSSRIRTEGRSLESRPWESKLPEERTTQLSPTVEELSETIDEEGVEQSVEALRRMGSDVNVDSLVSIIRNPRQIKRLADNTGSTEEDVLDALYEKLADIQARSGTAAPDKMIDVELQPSRRLDARSKETSLPSPRTRKKTYKAGGFGDPKPRELGEALPGSGSDPGGLSHGKDQIIIETPGARFDDRMDDVSVDQQFSETERSTWKNPRPISEKFGHYAPDRRDPHPIATAELNDPASTNVGEVRPSTDAGIDDRDFGDIDLSDIDPDDIEDITDEIVEAGTEGLEIGEKKSGMRVEQLLNQPITDPVMGKAVPITPSTTVKVDRDKLSGLDLRRDQFDELNVDVLPQATTLRTAGIDDSPNLVKLRENLAAEKLEIPREDTLKLLENAQLVDATGKPGADARRNIQRLVKKHPGILRAIPPAMLAKMGLDAMGEESDTPMIGLGVPAS